MDTKKNGFHTSVLASPNDNDNLEDNSGGLPRGEPGGPGGPSGPGVPGGPELLSGFKGSIETLGQEPEVFDGSDPQKLKTFFVNLALVFNDHPKYFTDQRKANIPDRNLNSPPAWTSSFKALVKELQDNFSIYDAQGEAEDSLGNLKMKETKNIWKYNIRVQHPGR
ncbi:hypothetical protein LENED_002475 [Lentinula edodes]|uniref:Uncharacterized protein n=1 Tax=Lentinula edodes TaxID=5353 RepID=A0A1Q3E166_LENED|nr:hypothetical protein LENED_002475 [Lentinula edodes]